MKPFAFLFAFLLLAFWPSPSFAVLSAEDSSSGSSTDSEVVAERTTTSCAGPIEALICLFKLIFSNGDSLDISTQSLSILFNIQKNALSKEGSEFDGSIPKLLAPEYKQDGIDPKEALVEAESAKVAGEFEIEKTYEVSQGGGTYTIGNNKGVFKDGVPQIMPIYDKFGFLNQALSMPGRATYTLPKGGEGPTSDPGELSFGEEKTVSWDVSTSGSEKESKTFSGPIRISTAIDNSAQAGDNLAKIANIFLTPGFGFKESDVSDSLETGTEYDSDTLGQRSSTIKIPIKKLGGAVDAYRCVTEQLIMMPGSGSSGVCEKAIQAKSILGAETSSMQEAGDKMQEIRPNFWTSLGQVIGGVLFFWR